MTGMRKRAARKYGKTTVNPDYNKPLVTYDARGNDVLKDIKADLTKD